MGSYLWQATVLTTALASIPLLGWLTYIGFNADEECRPTWQRILAFAAAFLVMIIGVAMWIYLDNQAG